jgi:glycosyltransferase involved in cell wall biosynthesis
MARVFLWIGLPARVCRWSSRFVIPAVRTMLRHRRDLWIFPAQDLLAYQAPVAALVSIHDLMHRYERRFPEVSAFGRFRVREQRFSGIAETACGILVDSETGRRQVVESYGVDEARVYSLPYVPPPYIGGAASRSSADFHRLPAKFAFYPAQFWPHKNHRGLLAAVAALRPALPDLHLVLSGTKSLEYASIAAYADELGLRDNVTFLGRVADEDIAELYRRARCLVMPTFFGPTNIPPLEAFALGCPVAVSAIYGMPEQVGDAALTFDPESLDDMAGVLHRLWTDDELCARLRANGLKRASKWNQKSFNRRFREILESVLRTQ